MEKIECSVAIQVLPGVERENVLGVVDRVIGYIQSSGMAFSVGPFETTVEGDLDTLMDMVKECQRICIREGAPQVMSYIKICYSPQMGVWSIAEKTSKYNG